MWLGLLGEESHRIQDSLLNRQSENFRKVAQLQMVGNSRLQITTFSRLLAASLGFHNLPILFGARSVTDG